MSEDMLEQVKSHRKFIQRIIPDDETWIHNFDMQTIHHEPKAKNHDSQSKVKVTLLVFFDYGGVVHSEFVTNGFTVKLRV